MHVAEDPRNKTSTQSHRALCSQSVSTSSWLEALGRTAAVPNTLHIKRFPHGCEFSLLQEFHCNMNVDLSNQLCLSFSKSASKHPPRKNTSQREQSSDLRNWPSLPHSWPAAVPPLAAVSSHSILQPQEGQWGCYSLHKT